GLSAIRDPGPLTAPARELGNAFLALRARSRGGTETLIEHLRNHVRDVHAGGVVHRHTGSRLQFALHVRRVIEVRRADRVVVVQHHLDVVGPGIRLDGLLDLAINLHRLFIAHLGQLLLGGFAQVLDLPVQLFEGGRVLVLGGLVRGLFHLVFVIEALRLLAFKIGVVVGVGVFVILFEVVPLAVLLDHLLQVDDRDARAQRGRLARGRRLLHLPGAGLLILGVQLIGEVSRRQECREYRQANNRVLHCSVLLVPVGRHGGARSRRRGSASARGACQKPPVSVTWSGAFYSSGKSRSRRTGATVGAEARAIYYNFLIL